MCLGECLQAAGLHQDGQPQLVGERQGLGQPEELAGGQGHAGLRARGQGLCAAQTGDGDAQRGEATQGGARAAEQEDGTLLRAGAHGHHGGHQAGKRRREEDLHAGREAGRWKRDVKVLLRMGVWVHPCGV